MWHVILASAVAWPPTASGQLSEPSPKWPAPSVLLEPLAGDWSGSLGYRDYQSGSLRELPVRTTIRATGDGVTQVRTSHFEEGRGRAPVYTTTISGFLSDPSRLEIAFFRKDRPVELQSETVTVQSYTGQTAWTLIYRQLGQDDNRPAEIRVTETRTGDQLLAVKEVRPVGSNGPWSFRNQIRLRRVTIAS